MNLAVLLRILFGATDAATVRSVRIEGTSRPLALETKAGEPLDRDRVTRDVRRLWATGLFDDIRVESDGANVVFRVVESTPLLLNEIRFEPGSERRAVQLEKGMPIGAADAQRVVSALRTHFEQDGYRDPRISATLAPAGGRRADLRLFIDPGERTQVGGVRFLGTPAIPKRDLEGALRHTRPRMIIPRLWTRRPAFSAAAVESDLARVRSLLLSRGYFDARVRLDSVERRDSRALIAFHADAGDRYKVRQLEMVDVEKATQFAPDTRDLCGCLFDLRRKAQAEGRLDFDVGIKVSDSIGVDKPVDLSVRFQTGPPYSVGRIQIHGNRPVKDATVRGAFVLSETAPFDWDRLERSLTRVDRLGLFEPLKSENVRVARNPANGTADLHVTLKQRSPGRWFLSGPVGPFSVGGPLQAGVSTRLPGWGRGILEASTYFLTFSVSAFSNPLLRVLQFVPGRTVLPMIVLERPYLPGQGWKSGFVIAPQLGWKGILGTYGSTQLRNRARGLLVGDRPAELDIIATVERLRQGAEPVQAGAIVCESHASRWARIRAIGATALDIALQAYP